MTNHERPRFAGGFGGRILPFDGAACLDATPDSEQAEQLRESMRRHPSVTSPVREATR